LLKRRPKPVKAAPLAIRPYPPYMRRSFNSDWPTTMLNPVLWLVLTVLNLYFYVILASVIVSWLIAFNIINGSNPYVRQIVYAIRQLTEPLLGPIRRMLPDLGGIDISPIILLLGLQFVQYLVAYYGPRFL
jgi:YggT family protein